MARAIFNNTNHPNNCSYYNRMELEKDHNDLLDHHSEIQMMLEELQN